MPGQAAGSMRRCIYKSCFSLISSPPDQKANQQKRARFVGVSGPRGRLRFVFRRHPDPPAHSLPPSLPLSPSFLPLLMYGGEGMEAEEKGKREGLGGGT